MLRFGSHAKKIIALTLALCFLFSAIPASAISALTNVQKAPLQIAVMADIHHYPQVYMGDKGTAWETYCNNKASQYVQSNALIDSALFAIALRAQENGCKYLFVPGDLTKDSEYEGHLELAARLERFEQETGIPRRIRCTGSRICPLASSCLGGRLAARTILGNACRPLRHERPPLRILARDEITALDPAGLHRDTPFGINGAGHVPS